VQDSALCNKGPLIETIRGNVLDCALIQGRNCRAGEAVAITYFFYIAVLASVYHLSGPVRLTAWVVPIVLLTLTSIEGCYSRRWSSIARDWAPLALILVGYWQLAWFSRPASSLWNYRWIGFDRLLLNHLGFRALLEAFGRTIPWTLEVVYLLLYTIPPLCMAALYLGGARNRVDRFLFTLFLGTFAAYALLPYFPTASPRVAFPNEDLPHYSSIWRAFNIWLLDRYDISTSVFPSGHVAVAFSSGFGLLRALPQRRWWWGTIFAAAVLVLAATVYCRYHYAADGAASVGISVLAWLISGLLDRNE